MLVIKSFIALISFIVISTVNALEVNYLGLGVYRDAYNTELLQLIFDNVKPEEYQIKLFSTDLPQLRAFKALEEHNDIDIVIGYATEERIKKYQAIPLPIMKGLNGWRIAVINDENRDIFKNVTSLKQLQSYTPGLFHTWTDNKIFQENGISTEKGTSFEGLFYMIDRKRFDYLPLSILEVDQEVENYSIQNNRAIMIEPYILIHYPVCFYFYVSKKNQELAHIINTGFERIITNGEFDKLFKKHHEIILKRMSSEKRTVIQLQNPLLPNSVPTERDELWLNP